MSDDDPIASPRVTFHLLLLGQSACGFGDGDLPSAWPPEHRWAHPSELDSITCADCHRAAKAIIESNESVRDALTKYRAQRIVHELRKPDGTMLAWLQARPSYCDRGRFNAMIEFKGLWVSDTDAWPRYYFDLRRAKAEIEAYLAAKRVDTRDAKWVEATY